MVGGHSEEVQQLKNYIENKKQQLSDKHKEYDILLEELEVQKEANSRAPAATMKKLVERLRNELALKEKQHQVCEQIYTTRYFFFLFANFLLIFPSFLTVILFSLFSCVL